MLDCYRPNERGKVWKCFITVLELPCFAAFFLFNIGVLGFNVYAIFIGCPFPYCGYIAGPFQIIALNTSTPLTQGLEPQYINMQKVAVTMATLSGSLSYLIMTYIVLTQYSFLHTWYENGKSKIREFVRNCSSQYVDDDMGEDYNPPPVDDDMGEDNNPPPVDDNIGEDNNRSSVPRILNPFLHATENDGEDYKKTRLYFPQLCCFYFFFLFNILLFGANAGVLYHILRTENHIPKHETHRQRKTYTKDVYIDYLGVTAYFGSQLCAIISCFIFSKVAYAVTIECGVMMETFRSVCKNKENEDEKLSLLQKEDKEFQKLSINSMKPYRVWFTVHWLLYAITAFVSLAYLAETIINWLYGYWHYDCTKVCHQSITYIFLFSLEHTALFLYPCFRAASILSARNSLIEKVCNKNFGNISPERRFAFGQYMKERKCGFVLSIFCAYIEFGFNIAYFSIFIGFLGIIIKLTL